MGLRVNLRGEFNLSSGNSERGSEPGDRKLNDNR